MYRDGVDGHHRAQMKVGLSQIDLSVKQSNFKTVSFCVHFIIVKISVFQRGCIDVRSMREKKKMKSYLVECLSTRATLKKTLKKNIEKKPVFLSWKKPLGWEKKTISQRLKWKNLSFFFQLKTINFFWCFGMKKNLKVFFSSKNQKKLIVFSWKKN